LQASGSLCGYLFPFFGEQTFLVLIKNWEQTLLMVLLCISLVIVNFLNLFLNIGPNGTRRFPLGQTLNTAQLFNSNGTRIGAKDFVNRTDLSLINSFYEAQAPIYITTYFAIEYFASFIVFTAALVHVWLWYGNDILERAKNSAKDVDSLDIHSKLMVSALLN
jgi:hypothetical protein